MDTNLWLAVGVIAIAVGAISFGVEVRMTLLIASALLGLIADDSKPILRTFLDTLSNEKFVVPICTAMGFAFVLRETGCDQQLVRLLIAPVRRFRCLLVPGVIVVGFLVNIPLVSQASTAVCLGTVVVPVMRAAGFSSATIGACLLLGSSVGGELLNPGAPELLTVKSRTELSTTELSQRVIPPLLLPLLMISTVVFWLISGRRRVSIMGQLSTTTSVETLAVESIPFRPWLALVPLVPLAILFLSGPPFSVFHVPTDWLAIASTDVPNPEKLANTRLIGLAMLVGVAVAAVSRPRSASHCVRAFFEGAGYGYAHVISLIVVANCFGKGIEVVGLAKALGELIRLEPDSLLPLAGVMPMLFGFVCGSGMASTQSLFGFFYEASTTLPEPRPDPNELGAMVSVGSAVGRTLSPVSAVTLMCAKLTDTTPMMLIRRVAVPLIVGLSVVVLLRSVPELKAFVADMDTLFNARK